MDALKELDANGITPLNTSAGDYALIVEPLIRKKEWEYQEARDHLLDSYLYAACSLKTHPEEFATLPDGRENRRRAIQFERVASYACRFADPFWADFHVDGDTRTVTLPNGTTIVETLTRQSDDRYAYSASGVPGIGDYTGSFAVTASADATELSWTVTFTAADAASLIRMLTINAGAAATMASRLAERFSPVG